MAEEEPVVPAEPVVEGDAIELPFATGHADTPAPSWQEPLTELAREKPELVVAGAFAGGLLVAMILRRLGN